jgi:hypothetical protein
LHNTLRVFPPRRHTALQHNNIPESTTPKETIFQFSSVAAQADDFSLARLSWEKVGYKLYIPRLLAFCAVRIATQRSRKAARVWRKRAATEYKLRGNTTLSLHSTILLFRCSRECGGGGNDPSLSTHVATTLKDS